MLYFFTSPKTGPPNNTNHSPLPPPTIESLAHASALLNKSAVARLIGLEQRPLNARIKNRTPPHSKRSGTPSNCVAGNNLALI